MAKARSTGPVRGAKAGSSRTAQPTNRKVGSAVRTGPRAAVRGAKVNPRAAAGGKGKVASRYRGEEGRRMMREDQERIKQRRAMRSAAGSNVRRLWMPENSERKIVVLDMQPDFFRFEHALMNPESGRNDLYTDCTSANDTCPVCMNTDSNPYYAMYMTVIDLESYEDKNGNLVEWNRRLLVVKSGMQKAWTREADREGNLRGLVYTLYRDKRTDANTGNQIELDTEQERYTEEELAAFVRTWKDRDNKTHEEDCSQPYDYDEILPPQSSSELAAIVGAPAVPGSRDAEEEELSDYETAEEEDFDDEEEVEDADDEEEDEEEEVEEVDADDEEEEEEEEEERPRTRVKAAGRVAARTPAKTAVRPGVRRLRGR
jgi:hypothetical protein